MKIRATGRTLLFVALSGGLLISCGQKNLPPITDAAAVRNDCSMLYQQFPVDRTPTNAPSFDFEHGLGIRKIPQDKWTFSIAALSPYAVFSYDGGIQIWIDLGKGRAEAYYVHVASNAPLPAYNPSNRFVFQKSTWEEIYKMKQIPRETPIK